MKRGVFSRQTFLIYLLIRIFLRKFHHYASGHWMIFPARKMYFNRKVLICYRYSVSFGKSILMRKNKL
jgi:hypothetical protein